MMYGFASNSSPGVVWKRVGLQLGCHPCFLNHPSKLHGLLMTDFAILNLDQVTRSTPELVPPSPNFHTIPKEGCLNLDRFNVHQPPLHGASLAVLGSNS
ncbi:hypothetical protein TNCV_3661541 [Trichonephila clavipes]|nr:hypothetical protein TNCV_3661541 [Trichonephila clavipes]